MNTFFLAISVKDALEIFFATIRQLTDGGIFIFLLDKDTKSTSTSNND